MHPPITFPARAAWRRAAAGLRPALRRSLLLGAILAALLGFAPGSAAPVRAQDPGGPMISVPMASVPLNAVPLDYQGRPLYVPGEVLVRYKAGLNATSLGAGARWLMGDARPLAAAGTLARTRRVKLPPGASVKAALAELRSDPAVESADPNYLNYKFLTPTDQYWTQMWNLENTGQLIFGPYTYNNPGTIDADVDASTAWDTATGAGVVIAIIDSGVDYTHPDLAANMWDASSALAPDGVTPLPSANHGYDFGDGDDDPMRQTCTAHDSGWHGTHVAGTAAAEASTTGAPGTGQGIPGMAFNAQIMAVKVFPDGGDCSNSLLYGATDAMVAQGIDYARVNGANIINLSLGRGGTPSATVTTAVQSAVSAGVLVVVAAGNSNSDNDVSPVWPANYADESAYGFGTGVISVMASDQSDVRAWFSNYGVNSVTLAAPGVNIGSTYTDFTDPTIGQGYAYSDGTSMASPLVAGIAALVRQKMIAEGTASPAPSAIKSRILRAGEPAVDLKNCTADGRRANAYNAVQNLSGGAAVTPDGGSCGAPSPPPGTTTGGTGVSTSGNPGPCLITWATEDWLPDRSLDPLRRVRESLWQSGAWGRALVRAYYRTSAAVLGWLYAPPGRLPPAGAEPALSAAPMP